MKERNNINHIYIYLKNKKHLAVAAFVVLLLSVFFLYSNSENFNGFSEKKRMENNLPGEKNNGESGLYYGEFEFSENKSIGDNDGGNGENNNAGNSVGNKTTAKKAGAINIGKELPRLLEIPKIGVSAKVQYVGLNSKNEMDVPSNDWDVAWYNLGPKPGEKGSAVIAGHLDSRSGQPAVFWNLKELQVGDYVFIMDGNNNKKRFQVTATIGYETGTAPLQKIFGASDGIYLNLITCGGVWDKTKNNYTERFVVYTKLAP